MEQRAYRALLVDLSPAGVLTLTLNRPERRNTIGPLMVTELLHALAEAGADASVRVIVITGAGTAFCAGGDFGQMAGQQETESDLPYKGAYQDLLLAVLRTEKPIIARVNGHALGGGLGLVAACTFAVASTEAKLGTPEIKVGLFPFMIAAVLERVMPRRRLIEMMVFGERLSAEEAERVGLVNRAVPPSELDAAVARFVDGVLAASPSTLRLGLRALTDAEALALPARLDLLASRLFECLGTEDAREGLTAFFQKRPPQWSGR